MGGVLQILILAMQEIPLAISTITAVKNLLSRDPAIPPDLQKILAETAADNAETISRAQAWLAANSPTAPAKPPVS